MRAWLLWERFQKVDRSVGRSEAAVCHVATAVVRRSAGRPAVVPPLPSSNRRLSAGRPTSYKLHEACVEMSGFWTPAGVWGFGPADEYMRIEFRDRFIET